MIDNTKPYDNQMGYPEYILDRFWSKVDVKKLEDGSDDLDACMEWKTATDKDGYGVFGVCNGDLKKQFRAHRFVWECYNGPILKQKPPLLVLHKCDNPPCVNPNHLWLGINNDNVTDMMNKNRQRKGSDVATSVLSEDEVLEIKEMLNNGISYNTISNMFLIGKTTVSNIRKGVIWSHITGFNEKNYNYKSRNKLNENQVSEILKLINLNMTQHDIAKKFNVSDAAISRIKNGVRWSQVTGIGL